MDSSQDSLTVAQASEAAVVELLRHHLPQGRALGSVLLGIGDDAAVLAPQHMSTVATVDAALQEQDFLELWPCGYRTSGADVGFKSAAQNLSDVNAMGAVATTALLVLLLPGSTPLTWVKDFAAGFSAAAAELGAGELAVIGGDLSASRILGASVSMTGQVTGEPLLRSGARPGHRLAVLGAELGRADAALGLLASRAQADHVAHWGEAERRVSRALFEPQPPLAAGPALVGLASAALDISDGLVRDASRLAAASGLSIQLEARAIEEEAAALRKWAGRHAQRGTEHVLYGGEDHLLLFTLPPEAPVPAGARVLGTCAEGSGVWMAGERLQESNGFDHFGG